MNIGSVDAKPAHIPTINPLDSPSIFSISFFLYRINIAINGKIPVIAYKKNTYNDLLEKEIDLNSSLVNSNLGSIVNIIKAISIIKDVFARA